MAALTASLEVIEKDGVRLKSPMAVDVIYRGAMVVYNTAGYLAPASTAAGVVFAGVSELEVDNSGGSAGDLLCPHKTEGVYLLTGASLAQTDVGVQVYASDDQTITKTSSNNAPVGKIVKFVSATQVWVKLDRNPAAAS